jgi:methylated-DNA-[protein]-cysteine S-methyltransferase
MSSAAPSAHYVLFDAAIGKCGVAWSKCGLTRLQLPEQDRAATERRLNRGGATPAEPPPEIWALIEELQKYFTGERTEFVGAILDPSGATPFDQLVYAATRSLSWGETASYGEIARRIDDAGTARAVGQALARNPIPIIVPCHRVLGRGHWIGGFSAYGGIATKERLLELEGAHFFSPAPTLPGI